MAAKIICFGAAHVDTKAIAKNPIIWGSKNPVSTRMSFGGVARNVAENLARLDVHVALVSRVGMDHAGDLVLAKLDADHIDHRLVKRSSKFKTANFTALIDPSGEMAVAMSDMDIYDEMSVSDDDIALCADADLWLLDANLPDAMIEKLARARPKKTLLWGVGTSVIKNPRFLSIIDELDVLVVNEHEAIMFATRRPRNLVVTLGRRGAELHQEHNTDYFPCGQENVVDTTGAGDAFVAGLAYGYVHKNNIHDAIPYAHACARMTLHSFASVCETLTSARLLDFVQK